MADSKEGMDDMIVCLMSMGFEIQECQDAINFGKTTVESAVEWLVSGKPGFKQQASSSGSASLRLRPPASDFGTTSVPYSKPHPIQPDFTTSTSASQSEISTDMERLEPDGEEEDMDQSEGQVVSRLHLSDNQRKQKDSFEQKKRDEARKQALLEKRRQKEEHARVLKEIAADREMKKLFKQPGTSSPDTEAPADQESHKPKEQKVETVTQPAASSCLLQIRLPDGKVLRQSFDSSASLQDVWHFTATHHKNMDGFTFIQPFPHHEFTQAEMQQSLMELKLVPTGSLVLQRKQIAQAVDLKTESALLGTEESPSSPTSSVKEPPTSHIWGQGHALETEQGGDTAGPGPVIENVGEEAMSDDEGGGMDFVIPSFGLGGAGFGGGAAGFGRGAAAGFGRGAAGFPGMGRGMAGGGMGMNMPAVGRGLDMFGGNHYNHQAFGGIGQRLVAAGDPSHDELANEQRLRPVRDLAFERAQARLAQPADPNLEPSSPTHQASAISPVQVNSLELVCLKHITHRLNDPRHQILSLAGISEDLAQVVLQYLIKEKQLKPVTLKAFIPCYLRKLVLDCYPYTTNELLHIVRLHSNLVHLSLSSCPLITDAGLQTLNSLKKLKKLNLSCCKQISNKGAEVFSSMQSLVSLNLEATGITDAGVIQYLESRPQHLQHLILNRTSISHAIIPHICNHALELRSLSVEDTKVASLSGIQDIQHLEQLNVARTGIVPESLMCIASCDRLKSLNLANTENLNGDDALAQLQGLHLQNLTLPSRHNTTNRGIQFLSGFPLVALDLTNYIFVGDEAMEHIGKIHSLKKLLLSNTKLTDAGMMFLEGLQQLEELNIDRTLVTDEGASIIRALRNLIELSMASTGITSKLLLSGALNSCTSLTKLNLSKTQVTSKGVISLSLPFLQLLSLDGTKVSPGLTVAIVTGCPRLHQMTARNLQPFTRDDEIEEAEMNG